jgi:hypothetical protein
VLAVPHFHVDAGEASAFSRRARSVRPLLDGALDEPTVFQLLSHLGGTGSAVAGDADDVRVGERSVPVVATGFGRR